MPLSRRAFLLGSASAAILAACSSSEEDAEETASSTTSTTAETSVDLPTPAAPATALAGAPFTLGLASGDPDASSVVLWTRLVGAEGDHEVAWEVLDARTERRVAAGIATATTADGHAVHVVAEGLEPDGRFVYRFHTSEHASPDGRTRTAPDGAAEELRFAFASCQDWRDGYWPAHDHLAEEDVDLVVFLGDYIYEGPSGPESVRPHDGPETVTLEQYRARYAQYRAHPSLQAAHAARPWVVVWDDHEVDNDFAGGADDIRERQAAAYKAWWEHMPVRMPAPTGPALDINRVVRWGELASFFTLDGRQFRSDQACGGGLGPACPEMDDPARTMLGTEQEAWIATELQRSDAKWNVVANQTLMADSEIAGFVNFDQWDGYPAAQRRMLEVLSTVSNAVVITGDVHASAVSDLRLDDRVVGVELLGTSISSEFPSDLAGLFETAAVGAGALMADALRRGYVRCTVTPTSFTADYRVVESVLVETSPVSTSSSWVINRDQPGVKPL